MLAHAVLAILAATTPAPDELHTSRPATFKLISLTCNEIQRLIAALIAPARTSTAHVLHRSRCRRRAQTRARTSHYQRQAALTQ